jgi:hypothetical protein
MYDYARLSDGSIVYIYGYENGVFSTVRIDREEESLHRPCEVDAVATGTRRTVDAGRRAGVGSKVRSG